LCSGALGHWLKAETKQAGENHARRDACGINVWSDIVLAS
jgi:hypothetical protein